MLAFWDLHVLCFLCVQHTARVRVCCLPVQAVTEDPDGIYSLVTAGVTYSDKAGANILYHTTECLCTNQTECLPPDHRLYQYTRHGLDQMVRRYVEIGGYIPQMQFMDPYLNGPEVRQRGGDWGLE
jgi:hypothetical protein